jgi:hypothetical protein
VAWAAAGRQAQGKAAQQHKWQVQWISEAEVEAGGCHEAQRSSYCDVYPESGVCKQRGAGFLLLDEGHTVTGIETRVCQPYTQCPVQGQVGLSSGARRDTCDSSYHRCTDAGRSCHSCHTHRRNKGRTAFTFAYESAVLIFLLASVSSPHFTATMHRRHGASP